MKQNIFKSSSRGLMGDKPMDVEYMPNIQKRAKRLKSALREKKILLTQGN